MQPNSRKQCVACGRWKYYCRFPDGGKSQYCKPCYKIHLQALGQISSDRCLSLIKAGVRKRCARCQGVKSIAEFIKDNTKRSGVSSYCHTCKNAMYLERSAKRSLRRRVASPLARNGKKICRKCGARKDILEFTRKSFKADGLHPVCRACENERQRTWLRAMGVSKALAKLSYWKNRVRTKHLRGLSSRAAMRLYMTHSYCDYCYVSLTPENAAFEHKTPRCLGGKTVLANLTIACAECNRMKDRMTDTEFRAFLLEYISRFDAPVSSQAKTFSLSGYAQKEPRL